MARKDYGKKSYHKSFRLRKVRITPAVAIGALASLAVVKSTGTSAAANTLRFISIDMSWSITDLAANVDDAFQFGVAHSDYTAAEIEECLEATLSMDVGDKISQERANRLVREIGTISPTGGTILGSGIAFNDGKPVKTRLNWLMAIGDTLDVWVRNGSGTVYTTGTILSGTGTLWVKD